ncbi:RNA ligase [Schizopora paradoxa]|uniref:tRNA ligase n=1 Tax=Schizopora paradoxa TaxID=27342 RepID=A0A0H2RGC0_9AGAM|nr:RNA ligase [Schizopora paradoxa]
MAPTLPAIDDKLVRDLFNKSERNKKLISYSTYSAPSAPEMKVRSWKMNEFKYYDVPSPFPTLARGIFTTWVQSQSGGAPAMPGDEGERGLYRIVARGYDKFFNIGEVPWTSWEALERITTGPYILTLKSNGCIIFVAALTPEKLLITSKHSLGPVKGADVSHAEMGERWLLRHLELVGKTTAQFAKVLWDNNWTAVAELCDDSFEEHVLAYSQEKTGLHLHGINESVGAFRTVASDVVTKFAKEWGFIETVYHTEQSIAGVRRFADEIEKSKKWNGEAIEGFVVRCHVSQEAHRGDRRTAPPYPEGSSFFFKLKYDEPYMMYRDWRELTKMLLNAKVPLDEVSLHKNKMRRPETQLYVEWVKKEISRDRSQFETYTKGKGIIATRERFLRYLEDKQASSNLSIDELAESLAKTTLKEEKPFGKTMIVPIAVPGVGKTMVSVALKTLFGFGHIQSDDIKAKKAAPIFVKKVVDELKSHDVVIADRNNHLHKHRNELRDAISGRVPAVRMLALHWALDKPPATIHRVCSDRVNQRGDNHQSLVADAVSKKHEEVIWMFINQSEELGEDEVDDIVDMDIEDDFEHNLDRAIDACVRILGLPKPSAEKIGQAMAAARGYAPTEKKEIESSKSKPPRYYALLPEVNMTELVNDRLSKGDAPEEAKKFWKALTDSKRVTAVPHITLVHNKSLPQEQALWDRCKEMFLSPSPPSFGFRITHVLLNDRVMSLVVDDLRAAPNPDGETEGAEQFVSILDGKIKSGLHITVGTKNANIPPIEGRTLVENWKKGDAKGIAALALNNVKAQGRVKGLMS